MEGRNHEKVKLLLSVSTFQNNTCKMHFEHIFSIKYLLIRNQTIISSWEKAECINIV